MLVIKHSVNTVQQLLDTPQDIGVHIAVRPYKDTLILNNDPFVDGVSLEEYLNNFKHKFLVVELKSDGIENKVIEAIQNHGIEDFFLLNVPPNSLKRLIHKKFTKFAIRFSDMESLETCKLWHGIAQWVWVDIFRDFILDAQTAAALKNSFKVCTISPELIGLRGAVERYRGRIYPFGIEAVCTNLPEIWK